MPSIKGLFGGLSTNDTSNYESDVATDDRFEYNCRAVQTKWLENTEAHYYKVALPGLTDKDIQVKIDDTNGDPTTPLVVIRAGLEVNEESTQDQPSTEINNYATPALFTTNKNQFQVAFYVPVHKVKLDEIQAVMDRGVLTVKFPKAAQAQVGGRNIQLNKSRL